MPLIATFENVEFTETPQANYVSNVSTLGYVCTGTMVSGNRYSIGSSTTNYDASFILDSGVTTEITRESVSLEEDGTSANMDMSVLHEDSSGIKSIENVISSNPSETILKSKLGSYTINATIDGSISWNTNDCALYLSSDKIFRFKYSAATESSPAKLSLEALNSNETEYISKMDITSE